MAHGAARLSAGAPRSTRRGARPPCAADRATPILSGEPATYETKADSGARKECVFCPTCGIRIYNALSSFPTNFNVKPGTLDDTSSLSPVMHTWVSSKQAWTPIPDGVPHFEKNPVKFFREIVMPLLPRSMKLESPPNGTIKWVSLTDTSLANAGDDPRTHDTSSI